MFDSTGPAAAAAAALMIIWVAEGWAPFIARPRSRTPHGMRNVVLGVANGLLCALVFPPLILWLALLSREHHIGLLHLAPELPPLLAFAAALLLLDFWHYLLHILWHKTPLLWRFHAVHHHDAEVDSTTAFRFHTGEIIMSMFGLALAVPILGVSVLHILVFKILLLTTSVFHHANVNIPAPLDRALRMIIVTPRMHWVHHSRWAPETDSNYSAIFSLWDRVFGTYRVRDEVQQIELGLDGYSAADTDTLRGMLLTPLGPVKSQRGHPPGESVDHARA
ncbi:MAG: sterol desaturase family protein [Phycisphaerales bacterium]|nr:sterol desaturase family protein [Phycisphaerales bacterium]